MKNNVQPARMQTKDKKAKKDMIGRFVTVIYNRKKEVAKTGRGEVANDSTNHVNNPKRLS